MPAMHGMDSASIHEDNELLYMDVNCYSWEFLARIPSWTDYYFEHDRSASYLYEKKVLQVLTWYRGPSRWLLKSPQHMENLKPLRAAFPDACLIVTHRDPVAVLQSLTMMLSYSDRIRRDPTDPPGLAQFWISRIERLLRSYMEARSEWPAGQSMDVLFHEYMADQEGVMRRIYTMAQLPLSPAEEQALLRYLNENPRNKHGKIAYDLAGDFNVDIAALRERYRFYYERFPVHWES
jgi:hypothetical protein